MKLQRLTLMVATLFFATSSFAIPIVTTFDDLDSKTLGTGGLAVYGTFDFEITNATGVVWTDFHFFDGEPTGIISIDSYVGPGTISLDNLFQFDIVGLIVGVGETLTFSITETCGIAEICSLGGAIWVGFPTTDGGNGVTVPEPGTLALLGIGLAGMALTRRRKKV